VRHGNQYHTAHREAFEALRDGAFENFALFSCFVNGAAAAAIVAINPTARNTHYAAIRERHGRNGATDHDGTPTAGSAGRERLPLSPFAMNENTCCMRLSAACAVRSEILVPLHVPEGSSRDEMRV